MPELSNELVEHFFRHESANLISVLTRVFGFSELPLIEDTVQSTLLQALNVWKLKGTPENPSGWIHRVAKNKILDALRRKKIETKIVERIAASRAVSGHALASGFESLFESETIEDSLLRMMFALCHPSLDRHSQIAMTLKILCGFNDREIASALLISEQSARKRIYRGRKRLAELDPELTIPPENQLSERLGGVNEILYLMFNEGYNASSGDEAIREDVCEEATRLCHLLCHHQTIASTSSMALLALMLYQAARFQSRVADDGSMILLEDQDRARWDQRLMDHADYWLQKSAGKNLSTFHLEAGIAQLHCRAKNFASTNWPLIVQMYDKLIESHSTPVYRLNRALAVGLAGDYRLGIAELREIASDPRMEKYLLLDCALAHLYQLSGQEHEAIFHLQRAATLSETSHERNLIESKLKALQSSLGPS